MFQAANFSIPMLLPVATAGAELGAWMEILMLSQKEKVIFSLLDLKILLVFSPFFPIFSLFALSSAASFPVSEGDELSPLQVLCFIIPFISS